jgi:integrase
MTFINRNDILYVSINGIRKSTKLKYSKENIKKFKSYCQDDEFLQKFNVKKNNVKTLIQCCIDVLADKEKTLKPSSYDSYFSLFTSFIVPYFKNKLVTDIKPLDINHFYNTFKDKSTLNTCNVILKLAFEKAILSEYIKTSPIIISKPKITSNYVPQPFNMEELKLILNTATGQFLNILGIAFFTGMRIGEIISLKWIDIDFINETIDINTTMYRGRLQTPKTIGSRAVIDLPIEAKQYFLSQRKMTGLKEYLFYTRFNKPYTNHASINFKLYLLLKELNLNQRGIHQTRHTFASLKLSYGEQLNWVSFMLRHDSPSFTQKVYYKYIPRKKEKRVVFEIEDNSKDAHIV